MSTWPETRQPTSVMTHTGHEPDIVAARPADAELALMLIRLDFPLPLQAATWA